MNPIAEEDEVEAVADELQREFADVVPNLDDVRSLVLDVRERYRHARVLQFVPLLVHRETRESLRRRRATGGNRAAGP